MFERFTESARQVVTDAQQEARLMRHGHIGTEHLLVALADEPALGLTREGARAEVVKAVGLGDATERGQIPFTAAAQDALEAALPESMQLGHAAIRPGHILLGVLRQRDGVALRVLAAAGTAPRELRGAVIRDLARPTDDATVVRVGETAVGDLGNAHADARLLRAILERNGLVAAWLRERGVDEESVGRLV